MTMVRRLRRRFAAGCVVALVLLAAPVTGSAAVTAAGWYVVSYADQIRSADRDALERAGGQAVQYLPVNTYVTWFDVAPVAGVAGALSVRPLQAGEKVAATVDNELSPLVTVTAFSQSPNVVLTALEKVVPVERVNVASPDRLLMDVVVRARGAHLSELAAIPQVLSIGPAAMGIELLDEGTSQIVAGNIEAGRPVPGYQDFLYQNGIAGGDAVTIAIADSGIDDTHPDLAGRVKARIDYTPLPDYRDTDGHGTHVAGIAGGSGAGLSGAVDPDGLAYGMGVAPKVDLIDVSVLGIIEEIVGIDQFPPFEQVSRDASRLGAIGWNASWGSGEGPSAGYVETARIMDTIVRDADWETTGAQPFILVAAAGNDGNAGMGAPSEAKNLIAVAASRSHRAGGIDGIAQFSSRGPAVDGRIGPTVAAPGDTVVSTRSTSGSVLCNQPPIEAGGSPLAVFYGVCSGTSMAAPHVTGAVAVLTEWWQPRHGGATPSPAMVKALLVNSATDMGSANIPNRHEGWGRVNISALLDGSVVREYVDQDVVFCEPGSSHSQEIVVADPSKPLKITLAWSDAPGAPNARPALVNDLDLTLTAEDGTVYRGNHFSDGMSIPGGVPDRLEVLENVFIPNPSGSYTLDVAAHNLPGDGIPYVGCLTDQDFALVVSNGYRVVQSPEPHL